MSVAENKEVVKRYLSWDAAGLRKEAETVKTKVHTSEFMYHGFMGDLNLDNYIKSMLSLANAIPDFTFTIEDMAAEGDKVWVRYYMSGTHKGVLNGIPPTGKKVIIKAIGIFKVSGDKIKEMWQVSDMFGLMQQIGAIPSGSKR